VKRILLIGAGHAHIVVLRHFAKHRPNAEVILVNDSEHAWYTGALPALIRGDIKPEQAQVDLKKLTDRASVSFRIATFERHCEERRYDAIHPPSHSITAHFTNHPPIDCDILSLSIGSPKTLNGIKPIPDFLRRVARWEAAQNPKVGIIGSGAAGIEIALALRIRLGKNAEIHIQSRDGILLPTAPAKAKKNAARALQNANIKIVKRLLAGLDTITAFTPEARIEVAKTLALAGHPQDTIFATGDSAKFPSPLPRSGAIAVAQGRTLAYNLTHAQPKNFKPPLASLAILSLDSTHAIAWYGVFSCTGRLPMHVKNYLDRSWIES